MLRYVQVHTLDDPINDQLAEARGGMEEPYDGVAEVWWPNREALTSGLDNAAGRAAAKELVEDEARFIDLAHSPLCFNYEYPPGQPVPEEIVARESSPLGKDFLLPAPSPSISALEQAPALLAHQPRPGDSRRSPGHGYAALFPGALLRGRTRRPTPVQPRDRRRRPTPAMPKPWFNRADLATLANVPEAQTGHGRSRFEDESHFIDFPRSAMWIAKERVFIDRPLGALALRAYGG